MTRPVYTPNPTNPNDPEDHDMTFTPCNLPADFTPYGWQLAVARRLAERGLLSVEAAPGAGKTLAAMLAAGTVAARSIVIVAPAGRVARQWVAVARDCGADAIMVGGAGQGERALAEAAAAHLACAATTAGRPRAIVIPWSRLARQQDSAALLSACEAGAIQPVDLLVVDESHYAQGAEMRARGLAMLGGRKKGARVASPGLRHYARRCLALSGTPTTSDPKKIRAQLLLAGVDRQYPELATRFRYEAQHWGGRKEYHHGARRELWTCNDRPSAGHDALIRAGLLRVSADDLRAQLPAHRRLLVAGFHEGSVPQELADWAEKGGSAGSLPTLEDLADQRREATAKRAGEIAERIAAWHREEAPGRMALVWCVYQDSADALAAAIGKALAADKEFPTTAPNPVARLHGGLSDREREATVAAATRGEIRVLVATHASTGTGVDGLQRAGAFAFAAEAPWTPGECEQSEGRLFRTGQTRPVTTEWLHAGIEGAILTGAGIKAEAIGAMLDPAEVLALEAEANAIAARLDEPGRAPAPEAPIERQRAQEARKAQHEAAMPDPADCAWSWARHRKTDTWAIRANCGGSPAWIGATVTAENRAGKRTDCVLVARLVGGDDWSLWSFKKIVDPRDKQRRDRQYLVKRALDRGIDQIEGGEPLTTPEDRDAAEAAWEAASDLTMGDLDHARYRNDEGWSASDTTVGRILCGIPADMWTSNTLAFARALLRKYRKTQIGGGHVARIWPDYTPGV